MELADEIIRNSVTTFFGIMQVVVLAGLGAFVKIYIDSRSHSKALRAVFTKVRALEVKVYGHETSESDGK